MIAGCEGVTQRPKRLRMIRIDPSGPGDLSQACPMLGFDAANLRVSWNAETLAQRFVESVERQKSAAAAFAIPAASRLNRDQAWRFTSCSHRVTDWRDGASGKVASAATAAFFVRESSF